MIPELTLQSLRLWIDHGVKPGSFLRAVLRGDHDEARARADADNRAALREICSWLLANAPADCFGSPEAVAAWTGRERTAA